MKACKKCHSKVLEEVLEGIFTCVQCQEIYSNFGQYKTLKKLTSEKEKKEKVKSYNLMMEDFQKRQTNKPYFRCRYFEVE